MANGDSQIDIAVAITAATGAGADQAIADINRVKTAESGATAASTEAAAAVQEEAAVQGRARQVAEQYKVSIFVAAQALDLLGAASSTAAIGSTEMDAAIESATRSTAEASAQRIAYNAQLRASTEAMLAEVAALDANASADEKRAVLTDAVTAALQRMGITEAEVALQAQKLNASFEGTARAMIQIKQAELATEVAAIRAEMQGITEAAEENITGVAAVGEQFSRLGTQRHVFTSIREVAQGGARAIWGEAEAATLLGTALNSLLPGIGFFVALASGATLVTQILEEHSAKVEASAGKAKAKTDEADNSSKTYAETLKSTFAEMERSAETAFSSIGEMYHGLTAQIQAAISATKELQRAQDEFKSAKLAAQIALLDGQEEQAEEGKTPDQKAIIKRQFTAQRLNLRQQFDEDKATGEVANVKSELDQAQAALALKQKELSDQQGKYTDLLKDADNASQGLAANGVQSDADYAENQVKTLRGKRERGAASQDDLSNLGLYEDIAPLLRQKENESGKSFDEQITRLKSALETAEKTAHDHPDEAIGERAGSQAQNIKDQLRAIAYYKSSTGALAEATKTNSKDLQDGRTALTELNGKIQALTLLVQAAELKASTLGIVDATQQQKLRQTDADAEEKHAFDIRQAKRDADIKRIQAESENPIVPPDQRAALKAQADRIAAQGDRDKLANANALGLSDAERIRLGGDAASSQTKASNIVAGQHQRDQVKQDRVESEQVRALRAHITKLQAEVNAAAKHHDPIVEIVNQLAQAQRDLANLTTQGLREQAQRAEQNRRDAAQAINNLKNSITNNHL